MKKNLILLSILLIATILRLYQLGNVPVSLDWDEAALSYNSYSISETGRDEYGEFLPAVLRSFNDYKPALYSYLTIPSIRIFGLNNFGTRFPSAVLGIVAVLATYYLVRELFKRWEDSDKIAYVSAFLLAISPWHIQFSRTAFEANIGLSFNILTALLFLKSFKKHYLISLSAVFSALSIYSYQSEKVFAPLFVVLLVIIFRTELFKIPKKHLFSAFILGLIVASPMIFYLTTNTQALSRARGSLITSTQTDFLEKNVERIRIDRQRSDIAGLIFDNRRVEYLKSAVGGYLSHFDPNWLFIKGDSARHHAPGMGILYHVELPFLLLGFYAFLFGNLFDGKSKKGRLFVFAWLLLAPVPAAFTTDVPHAVRTLNFLPTFQIFTAAGLIFTVSFVLRSRYKVLRIPLFAFCFLFFAFNIVYYLNQYFIQQNYFYSKFWQYGREEEVEFIKGIENDYDKIVVSDKDFLDQSYIFYLYYLQYAPDKYHNESKFYSDGEKSIRSFGKYEFRAIDWEDEVKDAKILYVGGPREFGDDVKVLKSINYLNGDEAVKIVEGRL